MALSHRKVLKKKIQMLSTRPGFKEVKLNRAGKLIGPFGYAIAGHSIKSSSRYINKLLAAQKALSQMPKKAKK